MIAVNSETDLAEYKLDFRVRTDLSDWPKVALTQQIIMQYYPMEKETVGRNFHIGSLVYNRMRPTVEKKEFVSGIYNIKRTLV
jgi:hypothetical protein